MKQELWMDVCMKPVILINPTYNWCTCSYISCIQGLILLQNNIWSTELQIKEYPNIFMKAQIFEEIVSYSK